MLRSPLSTIRAGYDVLHRRKIEGQLNRHRNPKEEWATAVPHRIIGLYGTSSDDHINPDVVDRTVTHMTVMVPDPQNWADGDIIVVNNQSFEIEGDVIPQNMGPIVRFNRLFGGHFTVKRVTG